MQYNKIKEELKQNSKICLVSECTEFVSLNLIETLLILKQKINGRS